MSNLKLHPKVLEAFSKGEHDGADGKVSSAHVYKGQTRKAYQKGYAEGQLVRSPR